MRNANGGVRTSSALTIIVCAFFLLLNVQVGASRPHPGGDNLAYVDAGSLSFGLAVSPDVKITEVDLESNPSYVVLSIKTAAPAPAVEPNHFVGEELHFQGDWLDRGDVYVMLSQGQLWSAHMDVIRGSDIGYTPLDGFYDVVNATTTIFIPRAFLPGEISDIYVNTWWMPCAHACLFGGSSGVGDRAPNSGFFGPFDPATGDWP